jgi:hypothetical protein
MYTDEEDSPVPQLDDERLQRLANLRKALEARRARLDEIDSEMYSAEVDENRGLTLRLRDEQERLELTLDPLEAEIYDLEYRKPARPAGR